MNLEQKLEAVQNQLNEIKSELEANKRVQEDLKKRNWPEKIEAGILFCKDCGSICLAKDRIKIEDATHKPTGDELVGKLCEFSDDGKTWTEPGECAEFDSSARAMAYHSAVELTLNDNDDRSWFEFARLAHIDTLEQRPDYTGEGSAWVQPVEARETKDLWEPSKLDYDRSIHANRDAKAWADFFVATYPGLADKHDIMLGWFANAMMAMHDSLKQEASAVVVPEITDERLREMIVNAARRCGSIDFDPEGVSGGDLEILREIRDDLANLFRAIPADRVLGEGEARIGGDELQMLRGFAGRRMSEREYDRLEAVRDAHEDALRAQATTEKGEG